MQLIVSHSTVRNVKSGGIVPFKTWAVAQGFDITDKAVRKAAMRQYDTEKKATLTDNRRLMAAVATDQRFDVKKFNIKSDSKSGEVIGYDISGRVPTKSEVKAAAKSTADDKDSVIKTLENTLATLMAKVKAMGVSEEDFAKVPALAA
jgi:hypothetical protein